MNRYKVTDDQIRDSYRRTRSIHKTAEELGRTGQAMLYRLNRMGEPIIGPGPRTPGSPLDKTRGAKFAADDVAWIDQVRTDHQLPSQSEALRLIVARDRRRFEEE
jgi:hypothetical protein